MTAIRVSTPSRLHFGLLRVHESPHVGYGGLGMMIGQPRVIVEAAPAMAWRVTGSESHRATQFARVALAATPWSDKPPALAVHIDSSLPAHRGLGGGSQLGLAIAAAVRALARLPPGSAEQLAATVGRGARSGVGSHGFVHGGLIWERGRTVGESLATLTDRVAMPPEWRVVLVAPQEALGLHGDAEQRAFDVLPPVPIAVTKRLERLAELQILPAARVGRLDDFGEAVYQYGRLSGESFAPIQGGSYASPAIAACVAAIRAQGVRGVGQSSWGPTVFAIMENRAAAEGLTAWLRDHPPWRDHELAIAAPDNRGAVIDRR